MSRTPTSRYFVFFLLAGVGLWLDLWSKSRVFAELGSPGGQTDWFLETTPVSFKFFTTFNEGALWGLGQGYAWLFALLSLAAFVAVLLWLFLFGGAQSLWLTICLGLVTSGTLGNMYDRLGWHGHIKPETGESWKAVRDFFYFRFGTYDYPIFNVADICLVTGAIMLVVHSFREPGAVTVKQKPTEAAKKTAGDEALV